MLICALSVVFFVDSVCGLLRLFGFLLICFVWVCMLALFVWAPVWLVCCWFLLWLVVAPVSCVGALLIYLFDDLFVVMCLYLIMMLLWQEVMIYYII